MGEERGYLSTAEVARRLGVKPETVYAYVSRGLLTSLPRRDRRRGSLFAEDEVARVAERGPHRRRPGADIRTELTELADDGLYYRGRDVAELATTSSPEAVARLLWTGEPSERPPFPAPGVARRPGRRAGAGRCARALAGAAAV
ncbi:MAG: citrate synthase, partial [Pseudonocardia sp.]|nr:citrate synthase [Pseudonocardia sp.]